MLRHGPKLVDTKLSRILFLKVGFNVLFREFGCGIDKTFGNEFQLLYQTPLDVEAKSKKRSGILGHMGDQLDIDKTKVRVGELLTDTLKKDATHQRIVFIDINMPPPEDPNRHNWLKHIQRSLCQLENKEINGKPLPLAYLFFTNHPFHYHGEEEIVMHQDFKLFLPEKWIKNLEELQEKDAPIKKLSDSLLCRTKIPIEFEN
jgi:hypothetical protein